MCSLHFEGNPCKAIVTFYRWDISFVGDAIVQADNAPDCGVAWGVIHGVPVRHDEKREEEEGEMKKEVERDKEEDKSNTSAHVHG